ncbi:UNVERIFIED_CONTAM: DEAD/DEAH box helicase family protein [Campylobacter lari]
MKLTKTQREAVEKLVNKYKDIATNKNLNKSKFIEFKAPTGSGKTFMMANTINQINQYCLKTGKTVVFVIATLSSSELPVQMERNLNEYRSFLPDLPEVLRKESPSSSKNAVKDADYSIKPEANKIYIFGTQSFGKNRIYTDRGIYVSFLNEIKDNG